MRRIILSHLPSKYVRALRAVAWNVLLVISGLLLIALAGEGYLRMANPFIESSIPFQFVDGVGLMRKPNAELRYVDWNDDNFVVSRVNGQGFVDREPISGESGADGCHIAFIGDSNVEAWAIPIADKFHVRLENMAARELPHLDIHTQAYGIGGTGQIHQLPFYDEYARHLNSKLVVLVFFLNDFFNNSTALHSLTYGLDPDRMPYTSAQRDDSGALKLRPPDPEYARFMLPRPPKRSYDRVWERLVRVSYFAKWLDMNIDNKEWVGDIVEAIRARIGAPVKPDRLAWATMIAARPCCASLLDGSLPISSYFLSIGIPFTEERLPPVLEDALEYTAFAIDQFKRRADRDGARLAIMAVTPHMGTRGDPQFDRLSAIAEARGIPVISDYDYIVSQGHDAWEGHLRFDGHWNATGHQWAAEAVMEWLKANQDVCD